MICYFPKTRHQIYDYLLGFKIKLLPRIFTSLRRMITEELRQLQNIPNFSHLTKLDKIKGKIINGDPTKEKILQFSDFFVYAPQIKIFQVTDQRSEERWNQIKGKYYQLDSSWNRRGYVVIT